MRKRVTGWIFSIFVGLIASWSYYFFLYQGLLTLRLSKIFILIYLFAFFTVTAYFLIFRFLLPRFLILPTLAQVSVCFLSLVLGMWFTANLPSDYQYSPVPIDVQITATGEKQSEAKSSEVWLNGLYYSGDQKIDISDLRFDPSWIEKYNALISIQNQPATVSWSGITRGDIKMIFVSHPWSGYVNITMNGKSEVINLYSEDGTQKIVVLPTDSAERSVIGKIFYFSIISISIGLLFLVLGLLLINPKAVITAGINKNHRWGWVFYALPMILTWTIYLLTFWPGIMSSDSIDQWGQVLSGRINDGHPAFQTMLIWAITRIWESPGIVAIFQMFAISIPLALILNRSKALGVSNRVIWLAIFVIILNPINGLMVITLWKDILYSSLVLVLSLFMLEIFLTGGEWLRRPRNIFYLGIFASMSALIRHNGLAAGFGALLLLMPLYRKQWTPLFIALSVGVLFWIFVRYPVYNLLKVNRVESSESIAQPFVHHIAAHLKADTVLSASEERYLSSIRPVEDDWSYNCFTITPTYFSPMMDYRLLRETKQDVMKLSLNLFLRDPLVDVTHMFCAGSLIWRFNMPAGSNYTTFALYRDAAGQIQTISSLGKEYGLSLNSQIPALVEPFAQYIRIVFAYAPLRLLLHQPGFQFFIILLGFLLLSMRTGNMKSWIILFPILLHSVFLMLFIVSQSSRYQYPLILFLEAFWPVMFFSKHTGQVDQKRPTKGTGE